ncbi:PD40 domain-containing protein [candidate division TA06 bacterium]|uniref:PD40 domain-containing protein n=1 Tax=candidate division TA06 bacterium TaxID=2250710 RepID=A0A933I8T7_UNCT6|nr:PD40 domain-containing protein [candidate division TA06 bacterium]
MKNILVILASLIFIYGCGKKNPTNGGGVQPPTVIYPIIDDSPAWHPDGNTIAYFSLGTTYVDSVSGGYNFSQDSLGIWLINIDGSERKFLLPGGSLPDWIPDGSKLAFNGYGTKQIFVADSNGQNIVQLTTGGRNFFPSWSPDGKRIAWDTNYNDSLGANVIWLMDNYGSNKKDISQHQVGEWRMPDWFPDGRIVHIRYPGGNVFSSEIFIMDSNGQNSLRLTNNFSTDYNPKVSPDGSKISWSSGASGEAPQIWVMNSNGSGLVKLTIEGGNAPCWSPDGSKIAYSYIGSGYGPQCGSIWIMNADGTNKKQLTYNWRRRTP